MFCSGVAINGTIRTDSNTASTLLVSKLIVVISNNWFVGWVAPNDEILIASLPLGCNVSVLARSCVTNDH